MLYFIQMVIKRPKINVTVVLLTVFVVLGTIFRLYRIEEKMRFIWDEGRDMSAVRNMIVNKDLTLFGPYNDIGGHIDFFGVFHYYLIAPSLLIANFDPIGPAVFTAILGSISIALVYYLVSLWHKNEVALISAGLFSLSPLIIHFSQWALNPNTIPFFTLLYFIALSKYFKTGYSIFSLVSGLLLGIAFQLHYFTAPLAVAWLVIILVAKWSIRQKIIDALVFTTFFILPNLTFVIFDLTHDHFYLNIITNFFDESVKSQAASTPAASLPVVGFKYLTNVYEKMFSLPNHIATLACLATIVFLLKRLLSYIKTKTLNLGTLFSFSWLVFLFQVSMFQKLADDYHSSSLWVSLVYFAAIGIDKLLINKDILIKFFGVLLLSGLFISQILGVNLNRESSWDENVPQIKYLASAIANDVIKNNIDKFNIASLLDPNTRAVRYRYFLDINNASPLGFDQYPNAEILYVLSFSSNQDDVLNSSVWEINSFMPQKIEEVVAYENVYVYKLSK